MKCPNCGEEITENSVFCVSCGIQLETKKNKQKNRLLLFVCTIIIIVVTLVYFLFFFKRYDSEPYNDRKEMNLNGKVVRLVEKSFYTFNDEPEEISEGGLFDDASYLTIVYGNEHFARINYKKWFISKVSDYEMHFDENGNIKMIRSIWNNGGQVFYLYDDQNQLIEAQVHDNDEESTKYNYKLTKDKIIEETMTISGRYYEDYTDTVTYEYNTKNELVKATAIIDGLTCYFNYENNRVTSIRIKDIWSSRGYGDHFINIEYNNNGDINQITSTGKKGVGTSITTFDYQYDDKNNWISRIGKEKNEELEWEITIRSTREYIYQ